MITEGAFGKLKGRWTDLSKKCESNVENVKAMTLARIVLHNLFTERGDVTLRHWDMSLGPIQNGRGPTKIVR